MSIAGLDMSLLMLICLCRLYGFSTFLPTIIQGIRPGSSRPIIQVLTIPVYALGAISYMSAARYSDWKQIRGPVVALFGGISVVGYALLISPVSSGVQFAGCFLAAMGLYVAVGIPLAWLPSNNPRKYIRSRLSIATSDMRSFRLRQTNNSNRPSTNDRKCCWCHGTLSVPVWRRTTLHSRACRYVGIGRFRSSFVHGDVRLLQV